MTDRITITGMKIDARLVDFVEKHALPGTGIDSTSFWHGFSRAAEDLMPRNRALLDKRETLQGQIDSWHKARRGVALDAQAYRAFLTSIGYLVPEGPDFTIETTQTDPEIANVPGPQLVVPVMNARYALNAANARWGSLYDALYGTDALGAAPAVKGYDAARGAQVIAWGRAFLDDAVPLAGASWSEVTAAEVGPGALRLRCGARHVGLAQPEKFVGYSGAAEAPTQIALKNHGLHMLIVFDAQSPIGSGDLAHISDIRLESAMSAIMDCEDSVAAVDAEDKVLAYSNWLGLMRGDLTETLEKNGKRITRRLNPDLSLTAPDGSALVLKSRALLLVRNVGHLMTNPAILTADGREIGEGIMDAFV
ncbi:MAG: malate synthase G, partial [Cypionkella sp.]|nr:malate synthase G [Cypionkella sp.]